MHFLVSGMKDRLLGTNTRYCITPTRAFVDEGWRGGGVFANTNTTKEVLIGHEVRCRVRRKRKRRRRKSLVLVGAAWNVLSPFHPPSIAAPSHHQVKPACTCFSTAQYQDVPRGSCTPLRCQRPLRSTQERCTPSGNGWTGSISVT